MGSFPLKNAHFPNPSSFNPQFENVPLGGDGWNFACPSLTLMANYSCEKFSPTPYRLATIHPLRTTDGWRTTTMTTARPFTALLEQGRLKSLLMQFVRQFWGNFPWQDFPLFSRSVHSEYNILLHAAAYTMHIAYYIIQPANNFNI